MRITRRRCRPTPKTSPSANVRLGSTIRVPAIASAPTFALRLARQSWQRRCMASRVAALASISS